MALQNYHLRGKSVSFYTSLPKFWKSLGRILTGWTGSCAQTLACPVAGRQDEGSNRPFHSGAPARKGDKEQCTWRRCACIISLQFNAPIIGVTFGCILIIAYTHIIYMTLCLSRHNISTTSESAPILLPTQSPSPPRGNHYQNILHRQLTFCMYMNTYLFTWTCFFMQWQSGMLSSKFFLQKNLIPDPYLKEIFKFLKPQFL